jgi:hypothetical protein
MVAVRLYHYYRQGVCACPIYISIAIDTFKVSIDVIACRNDRQYLTPSFRRYVKVYYF